MLGFAPSRYYYYMWKYISPLMLLTLLVASIVNMGLSPPGYNAWIEEKVKYKKKLAYFEMKTCHLRKLCILFVYLFVS